MIEDERAQQKSENAQLLRHMARTSMPRGSLYCKVAADTTKMSFTNFRMQE